MTISDDVLFSSLPGVAVDRDNADFYRGMLERRLMINRCRECGAWHHPPRPICPSCWSFNIVATEVSGVGTAYMVSRRPNIGRPSSSTDAASHLLVTVELVEQESLRFTAAAVDDDVAIGTEMTLVWTEINDVPRPVFVASAQVA
jgi:uncharacterized OB-fold protein